MINQDVGGNIKLFCIGRGGKVKSFNTVKDENWSLTWKKMKYEELVGIILRICIV